MECGGQGRSVQALRNHFELRLLRYDLFFGKGGCGTQL
jgi:hypothetical protein